METKTLLTPTTWSEEQDPLAELLEKPLVLTDPKTERPQVVRVRCNRDSSPWRWEVEYLADGRIELLSELVITNVTFASEYQRYGCGGEYMGHALGTIGTTKDCRGRPVKLRFDYSYGDFYFTGTKGNRVVERCRTLQLLPDCSNRAYGINPSAKP